MQLNKLQELHAKLRKAKYFYYEKHESIMSDYEFDMMESEYKKLAEVVGINDKHNMATQFVGFDAFSPMNLNNFYKEVASILIFSSENCPPCKRLMKIMEIKDKTDVIIEIYNIKATKELVEKYKIKASPTVVYLDKNRNVITKTVGSTLPHNLKYIEI